MTNDTGNTKRRGGLGGLLTGPQQPDAPEAAAPGRPPARTAHQEPPRPAAPALLPRVRSERVARDKLTVQIPVSLLDALAVLVERDGTRRYDEVEQALRTHFKKKHIPVDEES